MNQPDLDDHNTMNLYLFVYHPHVLNTTVSCSFIHQPVATIHSRFVFCTLTTIAIVFQHKPDMRAATVNKRYEGTVLLHVNALPIVYYAVESFRPGKNHTSLGASPCI